MWECRESNPDDMNIQLFPNDYLVTFFHTVGQTTLPLYLADGRANDNGCDEKQRIYHSIEENVYSIEVLRQKVLDNLFHTLPNLPL